MIRLTLTFLFCLLGCSLVFSQKHPIKKKVEKENRYALQVRYQLGNSFLQNPLVIMDNCMNCIRTDQEAIIMPAADITFLRTLNRQHALSATMGYSGYGFQNDHYSPSTQYFFEDYKMRYYFFSLGAGHLLKLRLFNFLQFNLGNSLLWDINSPPEDYLIKRHNLSYKGSFETEFFPKWRVSFMTGLYLRHAITRYNKIRFNKDYYPYNYGLLLGLKFNFDYRPLR